MKILFCDDEKALLALYKLEIEDAFDDIEVITAENGKRALELAKESLPTYVFTDGKMPDLDGLQLAERLQKELANPPGLFLITGYAGTFDEDEIKRRGFLKIFYKPIDYDELIKFIAELPR